MHKNIDVDAYIKILLDESTDFDGGRDDAARELGQTKSLKAFNALLLLGQNPDKYAIEDLIVDTAGESLGELINGRVNENNDSPFFLQFNPEILTGLHKHALSEALGVMDEKLIEQTYQFAIKNSSKDLLNYFFSKFSYAALTLPHNVVEVNTAQKYAKNAIDAFRLIKQNANLNSLFDEIVMRVLANDELDSIKHKIEALNKNIHQLKSPSSEYEHYTRIHIKTLISIICNDGAQIEENLLKLKNWITAKLPDDTIYLDIYFYIQRKNISEALTAINTLNHIYALDKNNSYSARPKRKFEKYKLFYAACRIIIKWFILNELNK